MINKHNNKLQHQLQINEVKDEQAMLDFGASLVKYLNLGVIIYLEGDLGTGKTTLVRGFLRAMGHHGAVKSPTFTIVEPYSLDNNIFYDYNSLDVNVNLNSASGGCGTEKQTEITKKIIKIYHFDLYRLEDPEELEYMGIRDYLDGCAIALIEWPEKGIGVLPEADIIIAIKYQKEGRKINVSAQSNRGVQMIFKLIESGKK